MYKTVQLVRIARCLIMGTCEVCGEEGTLLEVNSEKKGKVKVCGDCREEIFKEESESQTSNSDSNGPNLGCSHCG